MPDGYLVEIVEPLKAPSPTGTMFTTAKVILNMEDLDESIEFYTDVLGKLSRRPCMLQLSIGWF